jgi:sec-independent protein translocase protein TatA
MVRHLALEGPMDTPITFAPAIFDLGSGPHLIIILVVALLLFGRRLPEIMRGLGGSIREFKKGIDQGNPNENHGPDGAMSRQSDPPPPPAVNAPPTYPPADNRVKTAQSADEPPKQP